MQLPLLRHVLIWSLALLVLVAVVAVSPLSHFGHDYIQFYAAGTIITSGGSPYDPKLQAEANEAAGWKVDEQGLGHFRYLPYYYPPWLAMVLTPLLPLGFTWARWVWVALLIEAIIACGWLLRWSVPRLAAHITLLLVISCGVWWTTIRFGQVVPLVLLLLVLVWRLSEARWDKSAGMALACLSIKPQLAVIAVLAVILWAARNRRWGILGGFAAALAAIVGITTAIMPDWLPAMLDAPRQTPLVIAERPWMGSTWYCLSQTLGLTGAAHIAAWLLLAVPAIGWMALIAWNRRTPLLKVLAASALAVPLVVPYVRYYDLPILLLPLLWVLGGRLSETMRALWMAAFLIVPAALFLMAPEVLPPAYVQGQWLWMELALMIAWSAQAWRARKPLKPNVPTYAWSEEAAVTR